MVADAIELTIELAMTESCGPQAVEPQTIDSGTTRPPAATESPDATTNFAPFAPAVSTFAGLRGPLLQVLLEVVESVVDPLDWRVRFFFFSREEERLHGGRSGAQAAAAT